MLLRSPLRPTEYLAFAVAFSLLIAFAVGAKVKLIATLKARGIEAAATVLATRYVPSAGLSMFAKGRYAMKVRFRAGDEERVVEVVCARKPAAAPLAIVYDPRNPARVWPPGSDD